MRFDAGDTDGGGTHVHTAALLTQVKRHADDTDVTRRQRLHPAMSQRDVGDVGGRQYVLLIEGLGDMGHSLPHRQRLRASTVSSAEPGGSSYSITSI
jgi:hypothetical protein